MPEVSVVMPVYNVVYYIRAAIDSIINQSFTDWELILVDDCSDDGTLDILREYADSRNNIRLIENNCNSGGCRMPRFDGILAANGKFVCPIDGDDTIEPDYLQKQLLRQQQTDADMVLSKLIFCNADNFVTGKTIPESGFDTSVILGGREVCRNTIGKWRISISGCIVRRTLYQAYITRSYNNFSDYTCADEMDYRRLVLDMPRVAFTDAKYYYRRPTHSILNDISPRYYTVTAALRELSVFTKQEFGKDEEVMAEMMYGYIDSMYRMAGRYLYCRADYKSSERKYIISLIASELKWMRKDEIHPCTIKHRLLMSCPVCFWAIVFAASVYTKVRNKLKLK